MSLKIDSSDLSNGLDALKDKFGFAVMMECQTLSKEIESYAKSNRPWTDRTGLAKANLRSVVSRQSENQIRITLAHGVNYGTWLELANDQNYAVIKPTLQRYEPKVLNSVKGLLDRLSV